MAQTTSVVANGVSARPMLTLALIAFTLLTVMFLLQENGLILSAQAASYLHEATHDARHALGVPCH